MSVEKAKYLLVLGQLGQENTDTTIILTTW